MRKTDKNVHNMKVGQLIRRKTHDGAPIGPYMKITCVDKGTIVYAKVIDTNESPVLIQKKNVYIPKVKSLYISEEKLNNIKSERDTVVSHPATVSWIKLYEQPNPDLIRFICKPKMYEVYCVPSGIYKSEYFREVNIRIVIDHIIK